MSEFNLENLTEYLSENHFDKIDDDVQDSIAEDEAKSDTIIEKYGLAFLFLLHFN